MSAQMMWERTFIIIRTAEGPALSYHSWAEAAPTEHLRGSRRMCRYLRFQGNRYTQLIAPCDFILSWMTGFAFSNVQKKGNNRRRVESKELGDAFHWFRPRSESNSKRFCCASRVVTGGMRRQAPSIPPYDGSSL